MWLNYRISRKDKRSKEKCWHLFSTNYLVVCVGKRRWEKSQDLEISLQCCKNILKWETLFDFWATTAARCCSHVCLSTYLPTQLRAYVRKRQREREKLESTGVIVFILLFFQSARPTYSFMILYPSVPACLPHPSPVFVPSLRSRNDRETDIQSVGHMWRCCPSCCCCCRSGLWPPPTGSVRRRKFWLNRIRDLTFENCQRSCGTVGRKVACVSIGLGLKSSHHQFFVQLIERWKPDAEKPLLKTFLILHKTTVLIVKYRHLDLSNRENLENYTYLLGPSP